MCDLGYCREESMNVSSLPRVLLFFIFILKSCSTRLLSFIAGMIQKQEVCMAFYNSSRYYQCSRWEGQPEVSVPVRFLRLKYWTLELD